MTNKTHMEILQAFGLDIKLLIANLVNFLILVFILYKLGYKPILKFVKERQDKIEKGIKHAEEAAKRLDDAATEQDKILSKAHKEAQNIIGKAKDQAKIQADAIVKRTKDEASAIVAKAKKEISLEKEQSLLSVRKEAGVAVIAATEALLKKKVDSKEDKEFIEESLN
ncbi:MAG: ATP synthase F0 subunit B [Parcubacteria group bacterium CG22_combo_CG10-13_8_21_14_all_41_9]|nr:MAG: ATP synthase F0 subunit B [Parcubacteria group bacterium CG22_combo_CG10-13_8_21_14_all_41_9]